MSEDQKSQLERQLWGIANLLRGKISADDYRDHILGFIFYKYLSERQYNYANTLLEREAVEDYRELKDPELLEAIKDESLQTLGYFSYYIGHSEDPNRRLFQHNTGKFYKSTSSGRPWILKAIFQISGDRGEAMKIESFIKKQKSKILIEKLLDPRFVPSGSLAQLVRVPHVRD